MKDEIKEILNWLNQIIKENKESDVSLNGCVVPFETLYKLQDCITNLQQENEELKNEVKELERMCELYGKSIYNAELTDYKSRIDKAIKYIKSHIQRHDIDGSIADLDEFDILASPKTLLNILNGGDKDE